MEVAEAGVDGVAGRRQQEEASGAAPFGRSSSLIGAAGFDGALRVEHLFGFLPSSPIVSPVCVVSLTLNIWAGLVIRRSSRTFAPSCTRRRTAARRRSSTPRRRSCQCKASAITFNYTLLPPLFCFSRA